MSYYNDEPRYTIEQIDLLQRLRRSGMTKHEIIHALETMERLDQEQNEKFVRRPNYSSNYGNNVSASSSTASAATQTQSIAQSPSPSNSYDTSPPPYNASHTGRESTANERLVASGTLSPRYQNSGSQRSYSFDTGDDDADLEDKVEEYMRRDSNAVKEEIKAFLANRRISQAVVGQVTGISQSYISQWLLQQGLDMSEPKKRAFYRWYLLEKNSPGATLSMRPVSTTTTEDPEWRSNVSPVTGNFRLRRGSRFTWRKECLSVMESYFGENQYPDEAKREEIANACNTVIQKPGKKLSEFERVTPLKVYNWFANRRKEMKRRANIEAAILESHGIDVQSPGGHSNSDDIEGNDYCEQVRFVQIITMSICMPHLIEMDDSVRDYNSTYVEIWRIVRPTWRIDIHKKVSNLTWTGEP